jgi:hypothetical protein
MPGYARPTTVVLAQEVLVTPSGNISSTVLSSAIVELDTEKEKSVPLQSTAPSSPSTSDLWVDNTVSTAPQLKVYDGSSWISLGSATDSDQNILANQVFR